MVGEDETEELENRAEKFYEDTLAEEGGTGQLADYDDESYGYDYNDSNELTDVDSQPGYDDSLPFNEFETNDDFDMFDDGDEGGEDNFDGEDGGDFDGDEDDKDSQIGDTLRFSDPWGNDNDDEDEDNNSEDEDDDHESGKAGKWEDDKEQDSDKKDQKKESFIDKAYNYVYRKEIAREKARKEQKEKEKKLAKMLGVQKVWEEGDPITVETLSIYWSVFRKHVAEVQEFMNQADALVEQALQSMGPNMILKLNKYIESLGNTDKVGMVDSLLKLVAKPGVLLTYGVMAVCEAFVDQQWSQVGLIFGLKIGLNAALKNAFVEAIMQKIFSVGIKKIREKFKLQ